MKVASHLPAGYSRKLERRFRFDNELFVNNHVDAVKANDMTFVDDFHRYLSR